MDSPIFAEIEDLIPDEDQRISLYIHAGMRLAEEQIKNTGTCRCIRCNQLVPKGEGNLCCDACMDCQQCYHPKTACLCNNEDFHRHLRNIMHERMAEEADRVKNNGWHDRRHM